MQPDFRLLFESVPDPYLVLSSDYTIVAASNGYLNAAQINARQVTGKHVSAVFPHNSYSLPENTGRLLSSLTNVWQNKKTEGITIADKKTNCNWRICNTPVLNDEKEVAFILQKIEEVPEIAEPDKTIEKLREADRVKDTFLSSVSHDLRAPLHVISGYAQILLNDYKNKLDTEGQQILENIKSQTGNMGTLISALHLFTRITNKTLALAPTNMRDLVLDALSEAKEKYAHFNATVNIGNLPDCYCDPELLQKVWTCLIENAIKYSAGKKKPVIEIGSAIMNGRLTYFIKDNGAGFDMEYVHKLFQPFERLHHESDFKGIGLGLALAKQVIEKHGGQIWAHAIENKEASFYFSIPEQYI